MKLALAPINVRVGSWWNINIHQLFVEKAVKEGASLVVFPELSLIGYPPQDLLARPGFAHKAQAQLDEFHEWLSVKFPQVGVVLGSVQEVKSQAYSPRNLANCAIFLLGKERHIRAKTLIPYYDIFHESRYFDSAEDLPSNFREPIHFQGKKIGLLICEDSWHEMQRNGKNVHNINPSARLKGCDFLINISASPFDLKKKEKRRSVVQKTSHDLKIPIAYVNHFGAQDEILFDGDAFVAFPEGIIGKTQSDTEIFYYRLDENKKNSYTKKYVQNEWSELRKMLALGIRDYAKKNGFEKVVLGLSGGIDSALVACLAVDALGPQNVITLAMPSKFSSSHSVEDAEILANNLGVKFLHLPIKMMHSTLLMALKPFFQNLPEDITEENIQSRLRGLSVMAFANKLKALALATGNKSEFAVGYTTLYGDMCGALAPIGDLYKMQVYELAKYINESKEIIPNRTLTKAPSAELRPNQTDQDSLPPYEVLDSILMQLVEDEKTIEEAVLSLPHDRSVIERVGALIRGAEFKRNQSPPILKVSRKAFGRGRLYPITGDYLEH